MVLKSLPARHRKIADINKGRKNITQILDFTKNGDINRPENETAAAKRGGNGAARWRLLGGLSTRQHQREEECGEIDN